MTTKRPTITDVLVQVETLRLLLKNTDEKINFLDYVIFSRPAKESEPYKRSSVGFSVCAKAAP